MSQYPNNPYSSPYPPAGYQPSYYTPQPPDLGRPARWAGLLMIILGAIIILFGGLAALSGQVLMDNPQLPQATRDQITQMESELGISVQTLMIVIGIVLALPGLMQLILGLFVRRGSFISIVLAIIITTLLLLYLLINLAGAVFLATRGGGVEVVFQMCVPVLGLALFGLQMFWLVQAARNAGPLKACNAQQQAYQWQVAQQQQYYAQQAYTQPGGQPIHHPPPPPTPSPGDQHGSST